MSPKFLSATTILHHSPKQTRKVRKTHRDQEALIASELQGQFDLAPFEFDDKNDNDDHGAGPPDARKAAATCRTRDVKQGVKNWARRLTRRPKRRPTRHSAPTTPTCSLGPRNAEVAPSSPSLLTLPGELQNAIIASLTPVPLALLRLTCRHFYTIIPTPAFINPYSSSPLVPTIHPSTPDPVRLIRCHRFAFLTTLHFPPADSASPYLPRGWSSHVAVCGQPFYPCTGCKAFHHLDWFAPYGATVRKYPSLANRPVDCRACVLHTWMPGEEDGLYSPEVWPGFAERWRGWRVGRWWRCECCGRCVREGEKLEGGEDGEGEKMSWGAMRARDVEAWVVSGVDARTAAELENRSPGRYLTAGQATARRVVLQDTQ